MYHHEENVVQKYSVENVMHAWGLHNNFHLASVLGCLREASITDVFSIEHLQALAKAHWHLETAIGFTEAATDHLNYPSAENYEIFNQSNCQDNDAYNNGKGIENDDNSKKAGL